MVDEFTLEFKIQRAWGWLAILDFFLAGGGAGLFLTGLFAGVTIAEGIGLLAAALGALALLVDLAHPERFWLAAARPGSSWISRGTFLVTVFLVFGGLHMANGWARGTGGGLGIVLAAIAAIAAVGVMAYTGFLLSDSPGVPAWHNALVPILFVVFSLLTGIGGLYVLQPFMSGGIAGLQVWEAIGMAFGLAALLMVAAYLLVLQNSGPGARHALRMLLRGRLAWPFVGGSLLLGLGVPVLIVGYLYVMGAPFAAAATPLAVAGILMLIGALLFRYSLVQAGYYQPVL